jgi:hypothetical protein
VHSQYAYLIFVGMHLFTRSRGSPGLKASPSAPDDHVSRTHSSSARPVPQTASTPVIEDSHSTPITDPTCQQPVPTLDIPRLHKSDVTCSLRLRSSPCVVFVRRRLFPTKRLSETPTLNLLVPMNEVLAKFNRDPNAQMTFCLHHDPFQPSIPLVMKFTAQKLLAYPSGFVVKHYRCGHPFEFKVTYVD